VICILCEPDTEAVGRSIAGRIQARYVACSPPAVLGVDAIWDREPDWDDFLLVVYRSADLPETLRKFIQAFRETHPNRNPATGAPAPGGFVIPIACLDAPNQPPAPIAALKSYRWGVTPDREEEILRDLGTKLGLTLKPGNHEIFISYRSSDGREIAEDLHRRLEAASFQPWLDESEGNLPPGAEVQELILKQVSKSSMVLVVDTPDVRGSGWMRDEINRAIQRHVPVVPIVTGPETTSPRFIALRGLGRHARVKPHGPDGQPLTDDEWRLAQDEMEGILLSAYLRAMRTSFRAERAFERNGYNWITIDEALRTFEARRQTPTLADTVVLSHCLVEDITYVRALRAYAEYLVTFPRIAEVTHKLCIYDRDSPLSKHEIADILEDAKWKALPFSPSNCDEIGAFVRENFIKRPGRS
jgi:hypothetical protein